MSSTKVIAAREKVLVAALRVINNRISTEEWAHSDDEAEYAEEGLDAAARELASEQAVS